MPRDFDDAQAVEQVCYELKLADYPRGLNRARINQLFNGAPPYTEHEVAENGIVVNVNSLEGTTLAHDARAQLSNAFLKPGVFFRGRTDYGPKHKRDLNSTTFTRNINKVMKRSLEYMECTRSKLALNVLHGVGPSVWENSHRWCPDPMGMEDILIPGKTLITMKNLPLFAIYHSWTYPELRRLTRGPYVDPGWNMPLVEKVLDWVKKEALTLMGSTWPEVWSPEKMQERIKGDSGFYPGDTAPSIDTFDFYFWEDDGERSGWRRRIILDSWGTPSAYGKGWQMSRRSGDIFQTQKGQFLYNGQDRIFAERWQNVVCFQFADLSAVAPFQYHSVRSLGFLLYAVCHLQNRMRCKFSEAVFEALLNYFRIKSQDDFQRALAVQLANRGFIDDSVEFVKSADRWQVNAQLIELGLSQNQGLINRHSSSFMARPDGGAEKPPEMTATQWVGELQNTTQLVSAALNQAYAYQIFEDMEIVRRFCRRNSRDPEVNQFQADCLKDAMPEELLNADYWEIEHERVMGAGNMSLEMAIANWLMQNREKYEPDAQNKILRRATFAITGDPAASDELVPEQKVISDSTHDAQLAAATLLMGLPMALKQGVNHQEYAGALLAALMQTVQKVNSTGGVPTVQELAGMQNLAGQTIQGAPLQGNGIRNHLEVLGEDPEQKSNVKIINDQLGKVMNLVRAFGQRLQEQQGKVLSAQGGADPKDQAKLQAIQLQAQAKMQNTRESHAQRTAQRQLQFEQEMRQRQQEFQLEMQKMERQHMLEMDRTDREHALNVHHQTREHAAELDKTEREAESQLRIDKRRMSSINEES